ncbi:MAG: ExeM/NucH family extracellular endonuclease [Cyanobacteria bacterium J06626_6]
MVFDLIVTGVIDGPLAGGMPKAVEFYVVNDISDLSLYGFGSANNGDGSDGQEYTFSGSARAGDYLYIASEADSFTSFFGFAPTDSARAANINGDDAIEVFRAGSVIDVYGVVDVDGSNQPWEYTDGWAYRQPGSLPNGGYNQVQWTFSRPGALNESTDNRFSAVPFPIGTFGELPVTVEAPPTQISEPPPEAVPQPEEEIAAPADDSESIGITLISEIQGSGTFSPLEGVRVEVEAIVVGDFQGEDELNGFYLQEEDAQVDGRASTSEGLFVFDAGFGVDVAVGDKVSVSGTVDERFDTLTALVNVTAVEVLESSQTLPVPATVNFPLLSQRDLEAYEGMRITIPDTLYVSEYFNLDRFGELRLSSTGPGNAAGTDGRIEQYTQFNEPDLGGFTAYQNLVSRRQIIVDDGSLQQNPETLFGRGGQPLSASNPLRGGDTVTDLTGVLSFDFDSYRLQINEGIDFQPASIRSATPQPVGGSLKVASLNVLNFFTTLDEENNPGSGPSGLPPRGADTEAEFERQLEKLVTVLQTMDADIVGLVELENEFEETNGDGQFAVGALVDALNERVGADAYAFVYPGQSFVDMGDAISVGAIYQRATVRVAEGTTVETLTDEDLPALGIEGSLFDGSSTNRASLAVTFEEISSGETFTLSVNHLKSKGGNGEGDDADIGDGQGNFNGMRSRGAAAIAAWLATDPTGSNDSDILLVGDLNAYAKEEPIRVLEEAGYTDLAARFLGDKAYSFVFNGQVGTLDYAMANASLNVQVTGTTEWHINADEPDAIDYNLDFGRDATLFDGQTPFRTSDHDPIIVGLTLGRAIARHDRP